MNKRIKRIIAVALTINILSLVQPTKYLIMTTEAHATEATSVYLKNLTLSKSDIDFSENTFYYDVKVDKDVNEIKITAKPKSSDAGVTINDDPVDENDKYKKVVSIEQGNNIVKIKVTNGEEEKTYTLNILCGETLQDNIYLNNINLSNGNINFSKEVNDYNLNVKESFDKITIGAIPEQDLNEVTIDGAQANKDNDYKQTVELNKGMNPIIIKVKSNKNSSERTYTLNINRENSLDTSEKQDDIYLNYIKIGDKAINTDKSKTMYELNLSELTDQIDLIVDPESVKYKVEVNDKVVEEADDYKDTVILNPGRNEVKVKLQDETNDKQRIYTFILNRGAVSNASNTDGTTATKSSNDNVPVKYNQWVQTNGKWQYNDSVGNPIKNNWFNDINTGKWYFLGSDGFMQTGWILAGGKYYYLNSDGSMATNTTISGYKVGNDGAWVK